MAASGEADPKMIEQFVELTGADAATAKTMLEASKGDMEQALALHFDAGDGAAGAAAEEDVPMADEAAASSSAPALPTETVASSVGNILSNARQEAGSEPAANSFAGKGRALGSASAEADTAPAAPEADAAELEPTADRTNAKKIRVIFWADGFTVEDVTAEEEAAKAAEKAPPAPRRTGLASLSSEKARGGGDPSMPKLPELRPYEENAEFMKDLQQSRPPREFRELDLSTGVPRPRPVDIMLGDMRPQAYPAEFVRRQKAMEQADKAPPAKPSFAAFSGSGQTLGGSSSAAAGDVGAAAAAGGSASGGGETSGGGGSMEGWAHASKPSPTVDESAPTTEVQVRLAGAGAVRFRLNRTHKVADLRIMVEGALAGAGEAARPYILAAGFPPKPLTDDDATLEAAGLVGSAVTHRWA